MQSTMPPGSQEILSGRHIASLGTESEDGSIHLTAVWFLYEGGCLYVATSSRSRKALAIHQNVLVFEVHQFLLPECRFIQRAIAEVFMGLTEFEESFKLRL